MAGRSSTVQRPSASAPLPPVSSGSVQAVSSCLGTIKQFTRSGGFSRRVAQPVSLARRPSSRAGYQSKWLGFRQWCRSEGHSIALPSLPKIAGFLFWLRRCRRLSVSSVMGYRSMVSAVLCRFCRRFLHLRCFMICCGQFRQRHLLERFVLLLGI